MSSFSSTFVAGFTAVSLGAVLIVSQLIHGHSLLSSVMVDTAAATSAKGYVVEITAILNRYDNARRDGDRLLNQRDSDPRLVGDAQWRQSFGQVVQEHQQEQQQVEILLAPPDAMAIQQCFADGLRLTATGEGLLSEAFGAEGHRAYYLSAHGNWDLNLGVTRVSRCRQDLAAWQVRYGV
jgi:hypothetical protein